MKLFDPDPDNGAFTSGCTHFRYGPPSDSDRTLKIMVPVVIENALEREAMLDTGAPYFILSPMLAEELHLHPPDREDKVEIGINIRGDTRRGYLERVTVHIQTMKGVSYPFEVTAFVPYSSPDDWQGIPLVLGYYNCLDRIRFAIEVGNDNEPNRLYFSGLV